MPYSSSAPANFEARRTFQNDPSLPVVVIPAYRPGDRLPELIEHLLRSQCIQAVVVVNDGSGDGFESVFDAIARIQGAYVLRHIVNLGKGAALKTGLNHAACSFRQAVGILTADADGQHTRRDIIRAVGALLAHPHDLVLGVREFTGNVPWRSKLGNTVTRYVLRAVTGQMIADTQTGLRGIPMDFIPDLVRLRPNGYEFELEMLLASKRAMRRIQQVEIETIYLDGNRSSHFSPLLDSMRIYFVLIRFSAASASTAVLDNIVFLAAFQYWPHVLACQVLSRIVAGLFNYSVNKTGVFQSKLKHRLALPRYWASVAVFGGLSYLLITWLHALVGLAVGPAKIVAETVLFAFSFVVQRDFVFGARWHHEPAKPPETL